MRQAAWSGAMLVGAALAGPGPAQAAGPATISPHIRPIYAINLMTPGVMRIARSLRAAEDWSNDYPPDALAARQSGSVQLRFTVSAQDAISGCTVLGGSAPQRLKSLACALLRKNGRFRHALDRDGRPVASEVRMTLQFDLAERNVAPKPQSATPDLWTSPDEIAISNQLAWARFAPPEASSAELVVSVAIARKDRAATCRVEESSGNKLRDAATCATLQQPDAVRLIRPRDARPRRLPLLVRWDGRQARYVKPGRSAVPATLGNTDMRIPGLGKAIPDGAARLAFTAEGKITGCWIESSTGSDAIDAAACNHWRRKARLTPDIDEFGRKRAGWLRVWLRFAP